MGGKQSCPSDALDQVWVQDKDAPHCFNCGTDFTLRRRRHHCRCCGGVFCVACWGEQVQLEEAYGFAGAVPICSICGEVYKRDGSMYLLRKGVTVAQTHEPRSNVTAESQIPPLANANIRARKFRTNLLTLNHWRPFTKHTKIQLTKTKSSKEVLRAAKSAGLTPRGESNLSGRDSASGVSSSNNRDSIVVAGSNDDFWTIELDSIESIQLLSFDEKQGGEFICVTTNMEEHRIQAVKVRFEEVAAMLPNVVNKLMMSNNNNNNNNNNDYAGEDPTPSSAARGVPIPMNNNRNNNDEYSAASVSRGSVVRNGRLADRSTNGLGSSSYRSTSNSGMLLPNSNSNINNSNSNSNINNLNDNNDNDDYDNDGGNNNNNNNNGNALSESPGGEKCSASDRRSNVSANGARLRTVMLDQEATRNLYNALLRAHYVCRKRAEFVPSGVKCAVEVDFAESEVHIGPGAGSVTPRMATTRQSSPAGFGYSAQSHIGNNNNDNENNNNNYNSNSSSNFNSNNNGANTGRNQRTRAYTMA